MRLLEICEAYGYPLTQHSHCAHIFMSENKEIKWVLRWDPSRARGCDLFFDTKEPEKYQALITHLKLRFGSRINIKWEPLVNYKSYWSN